jgi:hypothetical protein
MMTSAVVDQSRSIGSGSAMTMPVEACLEFMSMRAPGRENSLAQLSKRHAIVYNYRQLRGAWKSFAFPVGSASVWHLLIRCAGYFPQASAYCLSADCVRASVGSATNRRRKTPFPTRETRGDGRAFIDEESLVDAS